ncbi:hypothetical protein TcarDRAFT_2232 [Thermosinus carboxydivorans Nor1]|uniref:Secreted protein n=1 Tax=Thermosinus carboxydivorans Nor1 TaxID=401526 RepID=A1HNB8_9FIRM|nr:hypothetical protein [Thermosinus carboxydivorans]EAX48282.1 hypothetical protein TcarDRAFT_2232 [Thermosinus carboxydivorans Nor1]
MNKFLKVGVICFMLATFVGGVVSAAMTVDFSGKPAIVVAEGEKADDQKKPQMPTEEEDSCKC